MVFNSKKLLVGTSGWTYKDWTKKFYPLDLPRNDYLQYYSQNFSTVEINFSFYRLPEITTFKSWKAKVPRDFIFSIKASRFITHIERLKNPEYSWPEFWKRSKILQEKLGPILFQLPPFFKADLDRLEKFLKYIRKKSQRAKFAFEFRHDSWYRAEVYKILKKNNACLVFPDSGQYPYPQKEPITSDFIYLRFHGPKNMFSSFYGKRRLNAWTKKIKKWAQKGLIIYAYFNNDANAHAVKDAQNLSGLLDFRFPKINKKKAS